MISSPVIEQVRPLLKLKMGASLTSEAENLLFHPSFPTFVVL